MNSMEINKDIASQLVESGLSYLWFITSLFEILKFIEIRIPLELRNTMIADNVNSLKKAEKVLKLSIHENIEICNIIECYQSTPDIKKIAEILNNL